MDLLCFIFFLRCFCSPDCSHAGRNKTADESYVNSCRVPRVIARWMPFEHCIGRLINTLLQNSQGVLLQGINGKNS